ncbi:MAG: capsule biosynthesis protein CapK, partial [Azoarcus sp.]|nr:capsule biosynthesis protein CapK [Azoarcus sp.]
MANDGTLPDERLFPILSDDGRAMLARLREHPAAPIYRNRSGHRLLEDDLPLLRRFTDEILDAHLGQADAPAWLAEFVACVYRRVPGYRARGSAPARFADIPTISRADLSRDITRFVPDGLPLDRLIEYSTSATTGHPLKLPSHPRVAASYLAFHRRALAHFGIRLQAGKGDVSVVLAGFQRRCFTYISVNPLMGEAGLAKLNLHPGDWRDPDDRARYLDALAPELITGDPLSLAELARLPMRHRPRALLSTSMALSEGLRVQLENRFACPVLDIYSMNEIGPIAVFLPWMGGHLLLQNRLYIETLLPDGRPAAQGERGEITLTGGFNVYLPLLRYRTGDWAEMAMSADGPLLRDFHGRPPVRFRTLAGQWINNVDVSHCLAPFALPQYTLHQHADLGLTLRARVLDQEARLAAA